MSNFTVRTALVTLAVTVSEGAVTRIVFGARGARPPAGETERRVAAELEAYCSGALSHFTFPIAPKGSAFELRVWEAVSAIPYGSTATYGEIARRLRRPGAARAVGRANGRNPIPLVIPCHRVVAAGGGLGGFGGGLELKRQLLHLESRNRPGLFPASDDHTRPREKGP